MPQEIKTLRDAVKMQAGLGGNFDPRQIGVTMQNTAANHTAQGDLESLPVDVSNWKPLQVVDPGSADLGKLYFVPGVDVPGNPNRIIR